MSLQGSAPDRAGIRVTAALDDQRADGTRAAGCAWYEILSLSKW